MGKFNEQGPSANEEASLQMLIDDILAEKVSLFDLLSSNADGDYHALIQKTRLFHVLARDIRVLERLQNEMVEKIATEGGKPDDNSIAKSMAFKDGDRRFSKLLEAREQILNEQPSFLTGTTLDECLEQYQVLVGHVERMWADTCQFYVDAKYHYATFFSILVIEEVGKLAHLSEDLIRYDIPRRVAQGGTVDRNHRRKHFVGVVSGALINARLDRVLGKEVVRKILHQAESGELEGIRQSCLYIDVKDGHAVTPNQAINAESARILTVLAGEVMAEVLGHFPWEFERMINNVIEFERAIGIPEKKLLPR